MSRRVSFRSDEAVRSYDVCSNMYIRNESNDHDNGVPKMTVQVSCSSSDERRSIDSPVPPIQWQEWVRFGQDMVCRVLVSLRVTKRPPTLVLLP